MITAGMHHRLRGAEVTIMKWDTDVMVAVRHPISPGPMPGRAG